MLGISIYPEHSSEKECIEYLHLAKKYNFQRVFTCLLSIDKNDLSIITKIREINKVALELGYEVILDVAPPVLDDLRISYDDLHYFKEMNATGIRLDLGFDGLIESKMTFNQYDLDIEINMSANNSYLESILAFKPNNKKLIGSFNFYPQRYTGLRFDIFEKEAKKYKAAGIRTAAFVTSKNATIGPWAINDGLCSLEMHRDLSIDTQLKHMYSTNLIDDIIIGNAFASEAELKAMSEVDPHKLALKVEFVDDISEQEKEIVLNFEHFVRGDMSEYLVRSTMPRIHYKDYDFPPHDCHEILNYGDIIIGNDDFGQYKGEMQLIIKSIPNINQQRNVVAKVVKEEEFLIDCLGPWTKFKLIEK